MANYGLDIYLNDEHKCRAGFEDARYVLTCILTGSRMEGDEEEHLLLDVGGRRIATGVHYRWLAKQLKEGDHLSVRVVKGSDFDRPEVIRNAFSEEEILLKKIAYYHRLKEELKEHLDDS